MIRNYLMTVSLGIASLDGQAGDTTTITAGLAVSAADHGVLINPGKAMINAREVTVPNSITLPVRAADFTTVTKERYKLPDALPDRWIGGLHLKKCVRHNALPGCLEPESVSVELTDGTRCELKKDYIIEPQWGGIARVAGGRITTDTEVLVSYHAGQLRLDAVVLDADGTARILEGTPDTPLASVPQVPEGSIRLANIFRPYHARTVEKEHIYTAFEKFEEPTDAEIAQRARMVPNTLRKLRAGQPVTIVTWGDSVTVGGDSSVPEKAYAPLFVQRLREKFPKATIKYVNAGIGATNTEGRLPAFDTEVIAHMPDLVTIEFINDMGFPEARIRSNYDQIFSRIRAAGAEPLLMTPHFSLPVMMNRAAWRGGETRPTVPLLRKVAAEYNVPLADTSRRWEHLEKEGIPYQIYLTNGINHPDDRGHELFVKDLLTFFPE